MVGFGEGIDRRLGQWLWLEFGSVSDGLHDRSVAGSVMVGGWIEVWWWVSFTDQSLVMGFVLRSERNGGLLMVMWRIPVDLWL